MVFTILLKYLWALDQWAWKWATDLEIQCPIPVRSIKWTITTQVDSSHGNAVSYTHLDVYKRQSLEWGHSLGENN